MTGLLIGLGAAAGWAAILIASRGGNGPWPPRRGNWFTAAWAWGLTILIYVGVFQVWADAPNALGWPGWLRWGGGGALMTLSFVLQTWGIKDLGLMGTSGWDVGVVTTGSYARLRHPQYLGQAVGFVGFALAAANWSAILLCTVACALFVWASRGEDETLARRDPGFMAYRAQVPFLIPRLRSREERQPQ